MGFNLKNLKIFLPVLLLILLVFFVKVQNRNTSCNITSANLNTAEVDGSSAKLSWSSGQNGKVTYLNVSTSNSLRSDGSLLKADIVNDVVNDKNFYTKSSLKPGTYYWNVVSDGCRQRKVSGTETFTVQSNDEAECITTPPVLSTPIIKDSKVTFNWTNVRSTDTTYINVSTSDAVNSDGILENIDISNDVVTGRTSFEKVNLPAGTYYWKIVNDVCDKRKVSELGTFTVD